MRKPEPNALFDLRATHNSHRFHLPVTMDLCVGMSDRRFLFGGVGLAAAIDAMQRTSGRPVIWATAHYLSFARPGSTVDLDVWIPVAGNQTSQAQVLEHIEDSKIISVVAALGARDSAITDQWVPMPQVAPPGDCPVARNWRAGDDGLQSRFEVRLAHGRYPDGTVNEGRSQDGRVAFWIRSTEGLLADPLLLAVVADYISLAIGNAIGAFAGGNSLDNTIRYARVEPSEWVLCDIRIESVHHGVVHGAMHLFDEGGLLMATASQSLILRHYDSPAEVAARRAAIAP
ncbi:acyl-CoA thioesterase [Sphingobium cupriresistens]|uniref:acyl-CoA thioesterase n=1 Tax=Sphingobium cupriresistens TaxID=1132417 RepID=UPI003BF4622E